MTELSPARRAGSLLAVIAVVAVAACSRSGSSTAPTPAGAPSASTSMAKPGLPSGVTPQMVKLGDSIFNTASCQRCHGKQGVGAPNGPALAEGKWIHISGSYDDIVKIITSGVPQQDIKDPSRRFAMRARGGVQPLLTDDQVRAVAAYVFTISHK